ncbi:tyrosine-type recombinase/integrase [Mameliella sp. AT18]|uniref:tyrosine-type recombinase/integrase n=1 Tax=Mameliella sp. AT18 TaxID=3028385 RepID=UPI00237A6D02|nr:tyrosine-type recombinase/integrase [Mameliella sp. AT18]MDD9730440.1 tyrosine-type recombinase/integrase [Mameliella sp. AT18]
MTIKKRGKTLSLYRRVPARYASIEPRKFVWVSLHTDSQTTAETKYPVVWTQMLEAWEAKLAGDAGCAEAQFEAARKLAQMRGFRYMHAEAVAKLPVEDLLERVEAVDKHKGQARAIEASAVLGGVKEPGITVTRALELYWTLAREKTLGKSEDQLRRWRNPLIKAVKNFVAVVGDKPIDQITRDDMLDFRDYWLERIETEGLSANSGNKDLIHLGGVLKTVNQMKRLGIALPLGGLSFKEVDAKPRPPFSAAWIRERLLAPGALDGLNDEARAIVLVMVNTGCRPSEVAGLISDQIKLSANVPHIRIEAVGRQLKSANARRVVTLAGVSLEALRAFPDGFPRYRANSAGLSATVNKYLRGNGLLETEEHSLYSLRHGFEDRMLRAGVDERIRRDVMGHALDRVRYGAGASLEHLHEVLQPVAL